MRMIGRASMSESTATAINLRGESGALYALRAEPMADFILQTDRLYLLSDGEQMLWGGTAADLIEDPLSRAGFRAALGLANAAWSLAAPADPMARMSLTFDLLGARPVRSAA